MKRLAAILLILAGAMASAQEYPKYTISKILDAGEISPEVFESTIKAWIDNEGYFPAVGYGFDPSSRTPIYNTHGRCDSKVRDFWWFILGDWQNIVYFDCSLEYINSSCIVTVSDMYGTHGDIYGTIDALARETYPNNRTYKRDIKIMERFNEYFNEFCDSLYEYLCAAAEL